MTLGRDLNLAVSPVYPYIDPQSLSLLDFAEHDSRLYRHAFTLYIFSIALALLVSFAIFTIIRLRAITLTLLVLQAPRGSEARPLHP